MIPPFGESRPTPESGNREGEAPSTGRSAAADQSRSAAADRATPSGGTGRRRLLTVGHGTLPAEDLASLLVAAGVSSLVDIRAYPGSRRNPQFGRDVMADWLPAAGVAYRWEPRLGGRRKASPTSEHMALREPAFRAYADHMATPEFGRALDEVLAGAAAEPTAIMCSESLWWRCHRRLVADAATLLRGVEVVHLLDDGRRAPHRPTEGVRIDGERGRLVYDVGAEVPLPYDVPGSDG